MKRTVFLMVALFALMAVGLYAQTEADFDVTVSKDGKSVSIDGYKGSATTVNIPAKIKNLPVTIIGGSAFEDNKKITSVVIPNGVTSIENSAFKACSITSITIPNSVTSIGEQVFVRCGSLTSVTIGSGVKSIGNNAFDGCFYLTSVTIPNSVTSIGNNAFANCTRLTNVMIGNGVTSIGSNAFRYDESLTSVTFGGTIPSNGFNANAFNGLGDIRDKYLAAGGGAGTYTRPDGKGTAWTKGASATAAPAADGTPGLKFDLTPDKKGYIVSKGTLHPTSDANVVIPATYNNLPVMAIANSAFNDLPLIRSVTIPVSVIEIGLVAFSGCASLNSVTFGGANTKFGVTEFPEGDLLAKYKAGGAGTYTRNGKTWTKK